MGWNPHAVVRNDEVKPIPSTEAGMVLTPERCIDRRLLLIRWVQLLLEPGAHRALGLIDILLGERPT